MPILHRYGDLGNRDCLSALVEDVASVLDAQTGRWSAAATAEQLIEDVKTPTFAAVLSAVYEREAAIQEKPRVFVKDNGTSAHAFELLTMFPKAQFVWLVRDPRDVAASWIRSVSHTGGAAAATKMWAVEQRNALHFYSLANRDKTVTLIHYEDLVSDSETTLRNLCAFLGEDYVSDLVAFNETDEAQASAGQLADWENLNKPFMAGNFGKYREQLSMRQIRTVERLAGEEMAALGYIRETHAQTRGMNVGRIARAGIAAARLTLRGPDGWRELRLRMRRLKNLHAVETRANREPYPWSAPHVDADPKD